jgi:predicted RNase H-like HicB family nuclease
MSAAGPWDEAALLVALPKDVPFSLQPDDEGGWTASIAGIPNTTVRGDSMEAAEALAMGVLVELMIARRNLARAKCQEPSS